MRWGGASLSFALVFLLGVQNASAEPEQQTNAPENSTSTPPDKAWREQERQRIVKALWQLVDEQTKSVEKTRGGSAREAALTDIYGREGSRVDDRFESAAQSRALAPLHDFWFAVGLGYDTWGQDSADSLIGYAATFTGRFPRTPVGRFGVEAELGYVGNDDDAYVNNISPTVLWVPYSYPDGDVYPASFFNPYLGVGAALLIGGELVSSESVEFGNTLWVNGIGLGVGYRVPIATQSERITLTSGWTFNFRVRLF